MNIVKVMNREPNSILKAKVGRIVQDHIRKLQSIHLTDEGF